MTKKKKLAPPSLARLVAAKLAESGITSEDARRLASAAHLGARNLRETQRAQAAAQSQVC